MGRLCGQTGDNISHYRKRRACTHDVGTGCKYWTGGVMYILVWCVILDRCVVCAGLVCCMCWTGMLHVLGWYVVCAGLVCWTGA